LLGFVETHQQVVSDQITFAQGNSGRVHAFEYKLRVISVSIERYINDT